MQIKLTFAGAIFWGGMVAGVLDISAVFLFWLAHGVSPVSILMSISTSLLGEAAFSMGAPAAMLGLFLHFFVSFVFSSAYVFVSAYWRILRTRPVLFGVAYGAFSYIIMTFVVVPFSRATFGGSWPPEFINLAASLFIHLFLFGLPIALAASRIRE